jgi:hypothetical protein
LAQGEDFDGGIASAPKEHAQRCQQ